MGKGRPQKYNRVTCQQKFLLRRLIYKEKMSVKQAAQTLGINYSTAKTIMFSYRQTNADSSLFSSFSNSLELATASYVDSKAGKRIQICCSVGGEGWNKIDSSVHDSTDEQKIVKIQTSF